MPWLIKDRPNPQDNLFFVHVPRCGGTSLMKSHHVPSQCMHNRNLWQKFGMRVFFRRYQLLESANFPWKTRGNICFLLVAVVGVVLLCTYSFVNHEKELLKRLGILFLVAGFVFFVSFTFIFTAPTIGRITIVRRFYLIFVHYVLCRFMESTEWCTGTNKHGYINHLTAHKVLQYKYILPKEFESVCTMAIVRNPYTRMVSIYLYNRFGSCESFPAFCHRWYKMLRAYRTRGEMEEWYTPCHGIPQFEYTHFGCRQLVQSIVKQEELGALKTAEGRNDAIESGSSVKDLPEPVLNALLGMPVTNQRMAAASDGKGGGGGGECKKWYEYYDQESLNVTFELYQHDFEIFQYSPVIAQRPDLVSPRLANEWRASASNQDNIASTMGGEGGGGIEGMEANGEHHLGPGIADNKDFEIAGSAMMSIGSAVHHSGYDELRRVGGTSGDTNDHNGSTTAPPVDDGQLSKGSALSSSVAVPTSAVELMRRNSNDKESDREKRLQLILSSSSVSSRRTSMRQEPLAGSGGSSTMGGIVATTSSLASSTSSAPGTALPSTLPRAPQRRFPSASTSSLSPNRRTTRSATASVASSSSTHTTLSSPSPPSPPRLSILVPNTAN